MTKYGIVNKFTEKMKGMGKLGWGVTTVVTIVVAYGGNVMTNMPML